MSRRSLERLLDYNHWANGRLFVALAQLTDEEFTREVAGSYGSIRNTMVHLLSAEWGWIDRCGGPPRGPALKASDYPTLASVIARWQEVEQISRDFLTSLTDDDLERPVEWTLGDGRPKRSRLGDLLEHGVIHAVHHRGQVALLARVLGHPPGNFDLLFYDQRMG
jgi:uncharacterized damage-inducible protein DinB